jgi:hypothetical protein
MDERRISRSTGPADRRWPTWLWAAGYASAYAPWMVLVTALAEGLLPGQGDPIGGPAQLPFASFAWGCSALIWTVRFGWLRRLPLRRVLGKQLRLPSASSVLSGAAMAAIVLSLSLAIAVRGSSPLSTVFVARAGVLVLAVLVDIWFGKRIGRLVGVGLVLALASILLGTLRDARCALSTSVTTPLAVYLAAYVVRLVSVSKSAKTADSAANWAFFVGEYASTASAFLLYGAVSIACSANRWAIIAGQGAKGTAAFAIAWMLATGVFSALIGLFNGLLFVSPEGNTVCALASRCAGAVGSVGAALVLAACSHAAPRPSPKELTGIAFTFGAIACLFAATRAGRRNLTPTVKEPLTATVAT